MNVARAIVLLSGGLDSAVTLALAQQAGRECTGLFIGYGQAAEPVEREAAFAVAHAVGVPLSLATARASFDSGLHDTMPLEYGRDIKEIGAKGDRPASYVPARNTILLSFALGLAESIDAEEIWIGANAGDAEGYPDCRPAFFRRFEALSVVATRGAGVRVLAPLVGHSKAEVVELAQRMGVDIASTSSCYRGTSCGACDACVLRNAALMA